MDCCWIYLMVDTISRLPLPFFIINFLVFYFVKSRETTNFIVFVLLTQNHRRRINEIKKNNSTNAVFNIFFNIKIKYVQIFFYIFYYNKLKFNGWRNQMKLFIKKYQFCSFSGGFVFSFSFFSSKSILSLARNTCYIYGKNFEFLNIP